MVTQRSLRGPWTLVAAVVALLVSYTALPLALAQDAHSMHGSSDHDHASHAETPTAPQDSATSIWKRITLYEFNGGSAEQSLSFCTAKSSITSMVFTFLPVNSTAKDQLERVSRDANRMASAFDSAVVTRRDVVKGSTVQVYSLAEQAAKANSSSKIPTEYFDVLYRARLSPKQSTSPTRCIDAVLTVAGTGMFVFFAEHSQANVSVSIIDSLQREVSYNSCISGCDDAKKDADGINELQDASTKSSSSHESTNWGEPVLASVVIALTSLLGVLVLSLGKKHVDVIVDYMMSFAAGCLLAVTVFHLYPEGSGYVEDMGEWVSGACVLAGIAFSMGFEQSLHLLLSSFGGGGHSHGHGHGHGEGEVKPQDKEEFKHEIDMLESVTSRASQHVSVLLQSINSAALAQRNQQQRMMISQDVAMLDLNDGERDSEKSVEEPQSFHQKYISSLRSVAPIAWITAMGDFFHAFTDGVVIAVAFKSCSSSLGWAVALGVVLHEVPHRVGDYFIFLKAGMLVAQALALNFLASLASLLAVLIVLSVGHVSDHTLGIMLSVGAGALLFIAMVKLLPPMLDVRDRGRAILHFLAFALGCIVIGLSMLQHAHCEVSSSESARGHQGHAH